MGYKPQPEEEPPIFAPVPKSHVPPPENNEPPNVDHDPICVWFFYPMIEDPISGIDIPSRPPEKGMWDPDVFLPPLAREWESYQPCDEMENETPYELYCFIPISPGPGQNDTTLCGALTWQDRFVLGRISSDSVATPSLLDYLSGLAARLGLGIDDPLMLAREYQIEAVPPGGTCEDCKKWWVGCVADIDGDDICEASLQMFVYSNDLSTDPQYSNGVVFGGKGAFASAKAFYEDASEQIVYICYTSLDGEKFCFPCDGYCNDGYLTEKECECSCLPEDQRPDDCVTPTPTASPPGQTPTPTPNASPQPTATPPTSTPTPTPTEYYTGPQSIFHVP